MTLLSITSLAVCLLVVEADCLNQPNPDRFDIRYPALYALYRMAQETPASRESRRLSTLAITDPAAYQAELRARGLWPVDLDEYLKRDRSKDPKP